MGIGIENGRVVRKVIVDMASRGAYHLRWNLRKDELTACEFVGIRPPVRVRSVMCGVEGKAPLLSDSAL